MAVDSFSLQTLGMKDDIPDTPSAQENMARLSGDEQAYAALFGVHTARVLQVAIITGSGQGLGAAAAELFALHGAKVIVSDIDGEKAKAVSPCRPSSLTP